MNPSEPTQHAPGSTEKIEVMRLRAEHGLSVFHPKDARTTMRVSQWRSVVTIGRNAHRYDTGLSECTVRVRTLVIELTADERGIA